METGSVALFAKAGIPAGCWRTGFRKIPFCVVGLSYHGGEGLQIHQGVINLQKLEANAVYCINTLRFRLPVQAIKTPTFCLHVKQTPAAANEQSLNIERSQDCTQAPEIAELSGEIFGISSKR